MKKCAGKFLIILIASWVIVFIIALLGGDGDVLHRAGAALVMAVIIAVILTCASSSKTFTAPGKGLPQMDITAHKPHDTGLISCRKCGFLGVGSGFCPRCGWTVTDKITTNTKMISCLKCGYLGAGSGYCPRCGWNRVRKIGK